MQIRKIALMFVLVLLQPLSSQAGITLLGGLNYANPQYTNTLAPIALVPKAGLSFAAFIDKSFASIIALETGVMYLQEKASIAGGGLAATLLMKRLHIPLMLRLKALPIVSIGAGVYYEFGLGDVEAVYTEPLAATVTQTYSDTGFKKTDYGLDFDLRFRIPLAAGIGLILDGRYQLALAERSNDTASSFKNRAITALGGVNFGF